MALFSQHELVLLGHELGLPADDLHDRLLNPMESLNCLRVKELKTVARWLNNQEAYTRLARIKLAAGNKATLLARITDFISDAQSNVAPSHSRSYESGLRSYEARPAHDDYRGHTDFRGGHDYSRSLGQSHMAHPSVPSVPSPYSTAYNDYSRPGNSVYPSHIAHYGGHVLMPMRSSGVEDQVSIERLTAMPAFKHDRNPFLNQVCLLAKVFMSKLRPNVSMQFTLAPDQLKAIAKRQYFVYLRLFHAEEGRFWAFNASEAAVQVNGIHPQIPDNRKMSKTKKKGHQLVRPLDISKMVHQNNRVEVCRVDYTHKIFSGLIVCELIEKRDVAELVGDVSSKVVNNGPRKDIKTYNPGSNGGSSSSSSGSSGSSSSSSSSHSIEPIVPPRLVPPPIPVCGHCGATGEHLLRCSRCKAQWYCNPDHQRQHWGKHREECFDASSRPPPPPSPVSASPVKTEGHVHGGAVESSTHTRANPEDVEGEITEMDTMISLCCPLSLERHEIPAKGKNCSHKRCFDLETFLLYSDTSDVWQCPVCNKPLPYEDIVIDNETQQILAQFGVDVVQVRYRPDGTVEPIAEKTEDERAAQRKRRQEERSERENGPAKRPNTIDTRPDSSSSMSSSLHAHTSPHASYTTHSSHTSLFNHQPSASPSASPLHPIASSLPHPISSSSLSSDPSSSLPRSQMNGVPTVNREATRERIKDALFRSHPHRGSELELSGTSIDDAIEIDD